MGNEDFRFPCSYNIFYIERCGRLCCHTSLQLPVCGGGDFRPLRFAVYCSSLACCFAFHAAYSRCPCPSSPCRARRTLTGMILQQMACRRKSSRPFCVTWFVSLFLLTLYSPFCRGVTLIYMKSCGAESFQSGRIWRYIGIY